jgi:uncharacterized protein YodC (DUF2158 family)
MDVGQKFVGAQIVALRSGGPSMTVVKCYPVRSHELVTDFLVKVIWFDGDDKLQRAEFVQSMLEISQPGRSRHLHFHPGPDQVLHAVGEIVRIEPSIDICGSVNTG